MAQDRPIGAGWHEDVIRRAKPFHPPRAHGLSAHAGARLHALGAAGTRRMQEQERVGRELAARQADDVPGARQPGMGLADPPLGLQPFGAQPVVR
jgi:hypothetical protein